MFRILREQASEVAPEIDWLHQVVTEISIFFTVIICGAMLYFAFKYRRRDGKDHDTPQIEGSNFLEAIWTIVPTVICVYVAYYGVVIFNRMLDVPKDALEISVQGQKWKWDFEYANGKKSASELYVPVEKPVKLVLRSTDVLHSFFIPDMRVKKDAVPGRYTYLTFKPIKTGTYQVFCTEYCGMDHSSMLAKLNVVPQAEFDRWYADRSEEEKAARMNPAELGQKLYVQKGCNACHTLNGNPLVGPSWLKIFGREGKLSDGTIVKADENYIEKSILDPNAQIVAGFQPNMMPSYQGQLATNEIAGLIAFMKKLDGTQAVTVPSATETKDEKPLSEMSPSERGQKISTQLGCVACHSLNGSVLVGPSWQKLFGRDEKMSDGSMVKVDEAYIKKSILEPNAQVVAGFQPNMMQSYKDQLTDDQIKDLIEYIKTIK